MILRKKEKVREVQVTQQRSPARQAQRQQQLKSVTEPGTPLLVTLAPEPMERLLLSWSHLPLLIRFREESRPLRW